MACSCYKEAVDGDEVKETTIETASTASGSKSNKSENELSPKDFLHLVETNYRVLPMFQHSLTHYKEILDLQKNEYLASQWDKFLDNTPPRYVKIRLFVDFQEPVSLARRKTLNGRSYYNHEEKLVPVPVDHSRKDIKGGSYKSNQNVINYKQKRTGN